MVPAGSSSFQISEVNAFLEPGPLGPRPVGDHLDLPLAAAAGAGHTASQLNRQTVLDGTAGGRGDDIRSDDCDVRHSRRPSVRSAAVTERRWVRVYERGLAGRIDALEGAIRAVQEHLQAFGPALAQSTYEIRHSANERFDATDLRLDLLSSQIELTERYLTANGG